MQNQLHEAYQAISLLPVPNCTCGECDLPDGEKEDRHYICETCHRSVPFCYGAVDDMFESCDDCWFAIHGEDK